jgi:predicted outer membrane protein
MKKISLLFLILMIVAACNQRSGPKDEEAEVLVGEEEEISSEEIEDMIVMAIINNRLKTSLALLANEKDVNPRISGFSEMIVENHDQFHVNMMNIAQAYDIEPPLGLTPSAQEAFERLSGLEKNEFEREFLAMIINVHEENLERFDRLLLRSGQPIERRLLSNVRETLQMHLEIAQNLQDEIIAGN